MNKKILDFYIKVGSNLESKGINEFVMPLELIQDFFVLCNDEKILILGGDIYEKLQDGQFVATYDNWYYEGYN
ncbi:Imm40 family immunity protein, partial [Moraxella catarrhalis]